MNSNFLYFISFSAVWMLSACGPGDHIWSESSNRVAREVRKTLKDYYRDINAEGYNAEFRYLDSSAMFSWHPPGYDTFISYDSVATVLKKNAMLFRSVQLHWDSLTIIPETETKARYHGHTEAILTDTTGTIDTFYLYEEGMLIKKEDGWKLLSGKTIPWEKK